MDSRPVASPPSPPAGTDAGGDAHILLALARLQVGTWDWDARTDVVVWNSEHFAICGLPPTPTVPRDLFRERIHPEDRSKLEAALRRALDAGEEYLYEYRLVRADTGAVRVVEGQGVFFRDETGALVRGMGILRDVTDARAAEREARASAARFRALFEQSQDALFIYGPEGVEDCNAAAVRLLRAPSRQAIIGRRLSELSPARQGDGSSSEDRNREIEHVLATSGSHRFDWLHRRFDGTTLPVEVAVNRLDVGGDGARTLVTWHDLTERQEAAEALRRSEERLGHSQKLEALGQLAGGIAHDFNNLLTVLRASVDAARELVGDDHESAADLREAVGATERAARLTRQLLAFSRRQVLQPRLVDLNAVLADAAPLLRRAVSERVHLALEPAAALPAVLADAGQLEQVLLNLVLNARDALPTDGGTITLETAVVTIGAAEDPRFPGVAAGPYVQLTVADTGAGIPDAVLPHIFEPFFTTKAPGQGTGLGLAMVYGIVRQSGGALHVDSVAGRGTSVRVLLPAAARPASTTRTSGEVVADRGDASDPGHTVLLVEDEAPVRRTLARLLARDGYGVLQAQHGADALRLWRARRDEVDVVLTDVRMPEMDGRLLAAALRADSPDVAIVFMSGYAEGTDDAGDPLGADEIFVEKPVTAAALRDALRLAVARRG